MFVGICSSGWPLTPYDLIFLLQFPRDRSPSALEQEVWQQEADRLGTRTAAGRKQSALRRREAWEP